MKIFDRQTGKIFEVEGRETELYYCGERTMFFLKGEKYSKEKYIELRSNNETYQKMLVRKNAPIEKMLNKLDELKTKIGEIDEKNYQEIRKNWCRKCMMRRKNGICPNCGDDNNE